MSPTLFLLASSFMLSIMGLSMHRTHLISALLCIEGMMLALFIALSTLLLNLHMSTLTATPLMLLTFSACEASAGLALLVATSRTHGTDYLHTMNLLKC